MKMISSVTTVPANLKNLADMYVAISPPHRTASQSLFRLNYDPFQCPTMVTSAYLGVSRERANGECALDATKLPITKIRSIKKQGSILSESSTML